MRAMSRTTSTLTVAKASTPLPVWWLAVLAPTLLAYNVSPSATLLNQLVAAGGWGLLLVNLTPAPGWAGAARAVIWPLSALAGLTVAVLVSMGASLPPSLGLSALALLLLAAGVLLAASGAVQDRFEAFAGTLVLAGLCSTLIAGIQVFLPALADGTWVAHSGLPGRAVGNLRQPNHLSSLLVWALIALVPVARSGRWLGRPLHAGVAAVMGIAMVWAVVLTASRTGTVGVLILGLWGALDRRLDRPLRRALLLAPVVYGLAWVATAWWAHQAAQVFGAEARLGEGDISSSRFGIWSNAWALVLAHPWTGVGFGEFNFAWTLGVFPGRPTAFFDHTHNLPLQFAVELGLPGAALVMAGLVGGLVVAARRAWGVADIQAGHEARAAWMMVLLIGVHSLLEYPLWYAYFLLPTAWAWGHALGSGRAAVPLASRRGQDLWLLGGAVAMATSLYALYDYSRVVQVFAAGDGRSSLSERIARGQRSTFFSHHADYAAATVTDHPGQALPAFDGAVHALIDTRLLTAWARGLDEAGRRDQARFLAERLREFRHPETLDWMRACEQAPEPGQPRPFQCESAERVYAPEDFTR
jgi:O-antigen ligase